MRFEDMLHHKKNHRVLADGGYMNPAMHVSYRYTPLSTSYYAVLGLAWIIFTLTLPVSLFFCIKIVHEYKRMVGSWTSPIH